VWASTALIRLNSLVFVASPHGASASAGYEAASNGSVLAGWLAGGVLAVEPCDALGEGEAALLQAVKTIASAPITASGDHLVVRDMHSSSNGSWPSRRIRASVGASDPRAVGPRAAGRGCPEA
jgi:hypothetical protein